MAQHLPLEYKNPFELLAALTIVAKDVGKEFAQAKLMICDPGQYGGRSPKGDTYAVHPDEMLYLSFVIGYRWKEYDSGELKFFLYSERDDDHIYWRMKLAKPEAKAVALPG